MYRRNVYSQCLLVKFRLLGPGRTSRPATAVGKSVGVARLLGFAMHSASTESEIAVSSGETGSVGLGANDTVSVAATVVAKSVERARPPGAAKYRATTESGHAGSSGEFPFEVGEARPSGVEKYRATTESEPVDRTRTHNTHLCSTVCSQMRNAHTTRLAQELRCHLCAPEKNLVIWCVSCLILGCLTCSFTTSTSSSSFTLPSATQEHAARSV